MLKLFGLLATTSLVAGVFVSDASAAITVAQAKIAAGVLTVTGTSNTGVGVTVDGQFPTNLGAGGAFTISVL